MSRFKVTLYGTTKTYYVYLLSNWNNKVLYIGVTNNLERRIIEHRQKLVSGFTKKYNVNKLVFLNKPMMSFRQSVEKNSLKSGAEKRKTL